jgi:alpha-glucosidase
MDFYPEYALSKFPASPNKHSELYAQFGLRFPLNEYRACWKMAGQPLAQRLHDKQHNWEDVQTLISQMLIEGLVGYTFSCPDMIGGGEYLSFLDAQSIDQDLVVRSAQIHALMPMMQFSVAPWRILDDKRFEIVKKAVALRETYVPTIMELAKKSAITGEPIVSSLEYVFPNQGFENVSDQFMLGENILVAPIINRDNNRIIKLPRGKWMDHNGKKIKGGQSYSIFVPLDQIPIYTRMK